MKNLYIHRGKITTCKLILRDIDKWRSELMRLDGKAIRITLDEDKDTRTSGQNRLYWHYLGLIESETGNDSDDLHEYFKRKHLPPRLVNIFNKEIQLPATTTKLDTLEFTNYLDKICAESGVPIPNLE